MTPCDPQADSDPLVELLKTFSIGELIAIAKHAQTIAHGGFGSVVITFERHHPKHVEIRMSQELHRFNPSDRHQNISNRANT